MTLYSTPCSSPFPVAVVLKFPAAVDSPVPVAYTRPGWRRLAHTSLPNDFYTPVERIPFTAGNAAGFPLILTLAVALKMRFPVPTDATVLVAIAPRYTHPHPRYPAPQHFASMSI